MSAATWIAVVDTFEAVLLSGTDMIIDMAVERSFAPAPVEHPLDLRIVFADDEGEFLRLWHGIHDDKKINWRNR